ncbi:hypothetical protein [Nocardia fusca]|uniref:Uncharacterized protein n=1 Tax=Nocardia fusca TaxID=941183 RepID=A0ABV3FF56_9NOCA
MSNYLDFYAHHREPGNRFDGLYAPISFRPSLTGLGEMLIIQAADGPDARDLVDEFVATICAGVTPGAIVAPVVERSYADTVAHVYYAGTADPPRVKTKAAYLRRPYTADQLRTSYRHIVSRRSSANRRWSSCRSVGPSTPSRPMPPRCRPAIRS